MNQPDLGSECGSLLPQLAHHCLQLWTGVYIILKLYTKLRVLMAAFKKMRKDERKKEKIINGVKCLKIAFFGGGFIKLFAWHFITYITISKVWEMGMTISQNSAAFMLAAPPMKYRNHMDWKGVGVGE